MYQFDVSLYWLEGSSGRAGGAKGDYNPDSSKDVDVVRAQSYVALRGWRKY